MTCNTYIVHVNQLSLTLAPNSHKKHHVPGDTIGTQWKNRVLTVMKVFNNKNSINVLKQSVRLNTYTKDTYSSMHSGFTSLTIEKEETKVVY